MNDDSRAILQSLNLLTEMEENVNIGVIRRYARKHSTPHFMEVYGELHEELYHDLSEICVYKVAELVKNNNITSWLDINYKALMFEDDTYSFLAFNLIKKYFIPLDDGDIDSYAIKGCVEMWYWKLGMKRRAQEAKMYARNELNKLHKSICFEDVCNYR